jgi:hypothetical protein
MIMNMESWLAETAHATASLIPLIWAEHDAAEVAAAKLKALEEETDQGYRQSAAFMDEFDDEGLATAIHWDTYFGPDKERHHAAIALADTQATLDARTFSRNSIASALLQIAKQGLSTVHGGLTSVPNGRDINGVDLKDVVWQGRNQAMHWEEGKPHPAVVTCFGSAEGRQFHI